MPGVISSLSVKVGQKVVAGDVLCSIEAMKMETAIHAEADGVVAEVHGQAGRPDRRQGPAGAVRVGSGPAMDARRSSIDLGSTRSTR